jgi:predicted DNA-binding protein (MmcQ/YjbR family)
LRSGALQISICGRRTCRMPRDLVALERYLRAFVQTLPGAWEDLPWGERVAKVGKKVFVFNLARGGDKEAHGPPGIAIKLGESHAAVAKRSFATPTGYGLGKSGWLTLRFDLDEAPTVSELEAWIEESYRLIAPKKLLAQFDARAPTPPAAKLPKPRPTRAPRKK